MKRYTSFLWVMVLGLLLIPAIGFTQDVIGDDSSLGKLENPIKANNITDFIEDILKVVVMVGTPLVVLAIIYSGFRFVIARGNPKQLEEAKTALLWTLVGAAIILGSWVLAQALADTVGCLAGDINC